MADCVFATLCLYIYPIPLCNESGYIYANVSKRLQQETSTFRTSINREAYTFSHDAWLEPGNFQCKHKSSAISLMCAMGFSGAFCFCSVRCSLYAVYRCLFITMHSRTMYKQFRFTVSFWGACERMCGVCMCGGGCRRHCIHRVPAIHFPAAVIWLPSWVLILFVIAGNLIYMYSESEDGDLRKTGDRNKNCAETQRHE